MSTSSLPLATTRPIVIGIDTHKDIHVAVALDHLGRRLAELQVPTTLAGCVRLEHWAVSLGTVDVFGIEGTGSYGAGLARYLRRRHHRLVEVNRPDRATRHRLGKSDPIDAEMAARLVLAGVASGTEASRRIVSTCWLPDLSERAVLLARPGADKQARRTALGEQRGRARDAVHQVCLACRPQLGSSCDGKRDVTQFIARLNRLWVC